MGRLKERRHIFDALFVGILFFVFLICALLVVTIGSSVYTRTTSSMNEHFTIKTALSYIVEKVRQNDLHGGIELFEQEGVTGLRLLRDFDGNSYETLIYVYDGYLKELFIRTDSQVTLRNGKPLMEMISLEIEQPLDTLYRITLTDDTGNSRSVSIAERSSSW